jgi:hypothetical protein
MADRRKLATDRPGDGHRVLEREEHAQPGPLVGGQLQQIVALPQHLAGLDHVGRVAHQGVGQRRLAGAVGAHDGVDLALADGQVDPLEDLVIGLRGRGHVQVAYDEVLIAHVGSIAPWAGDGFAQSSEIDWIRFR